MATSLRAHTSEISSPLRCGTMALGGTDSFSPNMWLARRVNSEPISRCERANSWASSQQMVSFHGEMAMASFGNIPFRQSFAGEKLNHP